MRNSQRTSTAGRLLLAPALLLTLAVGLQRSRQLLRLCLAPHSWTNS